MWFTIAIITSLTDTKIPVSIFWVFCLVLLVAHASPPRVFLYSPSARLALLLALFIQAERLIDSGTYVRGYRGQPLRRAALYIMACCKPYSSRLFRKASFCAHWTGSCAPFFHVPSHDEYVKVSYGVHSMCGPCIARHVPHKESFCFPAITPL